MCYFYNVSSTREEESYNIGTALERHVEYDANVLMIPCPKAHNIISMGLLGSTTPGAPDTGGQGASDIAKTHASSLHHDIIMTTLEQLIGACDYTYICYN